MTRFFLLLFVGFTFLAAPIAPVVAQTADVIIIPMEKLPSYGSLVSAWYKQPVYDPNEKKVGTVGDMLFDRGSVSAVMLNVGGFLGIGAKHVAVPVEAISVTEKNGKSWLTINTTKDVLKKAAGYKFDAKTHSWNPM